MKNGLIAFCGVDCSACPDYVQEKCPGCRDSVWPEGDACMPVACCEEKGLSSCGECPGFPCSEMESFYTESESHREAFVRMMERREQLERIGHFEKILQELQQLLSEPDAEALAAFREKAEELAAYYESEDWKRDFADEEAGLLPRDLPRGVLSEDGIWNALEAWQECLEEADPE